jgi:hypothetical protein
MKTTPDQSTGTCAPVKRKICTIVFRPDDVDLAQLADALKRTFENSPPIGYLLGRTALRDAVVDHLRCSLLEAEQLVDTMVSRGFLQYQGAPAEKIDDLEPWLISREPPAAW